MTKTKTKNTLADVAKVIAQGNEPIDTKAVETFADAKQQQLDDQVAASIDGVERAEETQALTSKLIEDRVIALCMGANHVFFESQLRQEGDNGFFYALDYNGWDSRDDGAQPTGRIVPVDRYQFLDGSVVRGIVSNFDYLLTQKQSGSERLRDQIRRAIAHAERFGIDNSDEIGRMADRLENSVDQEAMLKVAFLTASECYHSITGKVYETKDERAATRAAAAKKASADPRLAKLGC